MQKIHKWVDKHLQSTSMHQTSFIFLGLPLSESIDLQLSDDKLQMTTEAMKIHTIDWTILDFDRKEID